MWNNFSLPHIHIETNWPPRISTKQIDHRLDSRNLPFFFDCFSSDISWKKAFSSLFLPIRIILFNTLAHLYSTRIPGRRKKVICVLVLLLKSDEHCYVTQIEFFIPGIEMCSIMRGESYVCWICAFELHQKLLSYVPKINQFVV